MRCLRCYSENKAARKFCAECGQALALACFACGFVNDPFDQFCGGCGQSLAVTKHSMLPGRLATASEAQLQIPLTISPIASNPPAAERRHLTVMFCDLVGSTSLSEQLDPEDLREVVRAFQQTSADVIHRLDGYIAQLLGDGLLVYFGWPRAHDDDAQRAVHAGLGILEATDALNTRLERERGLRLAVRVGIHTGLAVVGEMGAGGRHEQLALGETPNVAALVQKIAAPNTVLISAATHRLVKGYFIVASLSPQALKGLNAPVSVFRILGASAAENRLDVAGSTGSTPLVGREAEVALLIERWERSQAGQGQVVLLSGEGGIGKSRMVRALLEQVASQGSPCIVLRCSAYHSNSALYPVIEHLQKWLQFRRDDAPEEKLRKLEEALKRTPPAGMGEMGKGPEVVLLLAALLSIPVTETRYPPLLLTPQQQRQRTLDALMGWLLAEAEQQPVLVVWEDLHWADPSTLELLGLVIEQAPTTRVLTLMTSRLEFRPPWSFGSHLTQLVLSRLPRPRVEAMVRQLTGGKALPTAVLVQVVAKTDGVPLFVEELVKLVLESGLVREESDCYVLNGPLPALAIPATLQDSLMARLDRLRAARFVAQLGAVLGRRFSDELIQSVKLLDDETLQRGLSQLVDAELLYRRGRPPQAQYIFKHALIQETAYQSLLKNTRQRYHQRIAQTLAEGFGEIIETQPELVAHHYTEAGLAAEAIPFWHRAGQQALQRSASVEAVRHFTTAVSLVATLSEVPGRAQQELDLQIVLGSALIAIKGQAAPEVEQAYARALALCEQVGETAQLFPALRGLCRVYQNRAALTTARDLGERLYGLAQHDATPTSLLEAHDAHGTTLFYLGEYAAARTHLERGISLTDRAGERDLALRHGEAPGVRCLSMAGLTLWCLGYPTQAVRRSNEALALSQELAHLPSLANARHWAAYLHHRRREIQPVQAHADALLSLAIEQEFPLYVGHAMCWRGWTLAMQGQTAIGLAQVREGMAAVLATGQVLSRPRYLVLQAEAAGHAGQVSEALRLLAEAFAGLKASGWEDLLAEAYRLQGELLLRNIIPDVSQAEACFQQALAIARHQQSKSWELRAATNLSRLWQRQGKRSEAHELLVPIYDWFTEGFETADLLEAKALLEELA